nr:DUF2254 domain-containing protein [Sphingomicrobium lutaoense]
MAERALEAKLFGADWRAAQQGAGSADGTAWPATRWVGKQGEEIAVPRWRWFIQQLVRRIWFRAAAISAGSVLIALAAAWLAPIIPYEFSVTMGADAVDDILTILASSMLAVTTFSLTAMVAAFSGAAQMGSPRATELLIEDAAAQNAISTFLGGFLFAIVGLVALSSQLYGPQGRVVLFIGTIGVIVWISITLLRWIAQLSTFGRVGDTIKRVERQAIAALDAYPGPTLFAGRVETHAPEAAAQSFSCDRTGYVAHVDRGKLSSLVRDEGAQLHLVSAAGHFVDPGLPVAWADAPVEGLTDEMVCDAFSIARSRDFDQDPRFGMVVLAEVASRALSPAVNDPGTAIASLVAGQRVLDHFIDPERPPSPPLPGLVDMPLSLQEMVEDLVLPIARDGAGVVEVGMQVQKLLGSLARRCPGARKWLLEMAEHCLERSRAAMADEMEKQRLGRAYRRAFDIPA